MSETAVVEMLIVDFLDWVALKERTYEQVMDAWRTSCPRLQVWEEANDRGLVRIENLDGQLMVRVTPAGSAALDARRGASRT